MHIHNKFHQKSEWLIIIKRHWAFLSMARTIYIFQSDDDVLFALDEPSHFDFHSASSLKQQSSDRGSHQHGHNNILIPSQPVFALTL